MPEAAYSSNMTDGGLLLWVRTRDADCEQRALEILRHHSARDVHLHQIPERACKESDVPRERPRVVHLLDREYSFDFLGRPPTLKRGRAECVANSLHVQ